MENYICCVFNLRMQNLLITKITIILYNENTIILAELCFRANLFMSKQFHDHHWIETFDSEASHELIVA